MIYGLLADSSSWPEWTPIDSYELVEPPRPDGVGGVRVFRTGRIRVKERIVERVPDRRVSYVLLEGLAIRDYRADVDLNAVDGGTAVRWHTTFRPKVPGMGWIYRRALLKATQAFVEGLARHTTQMNEQRLTNPTVIE